MKRLWARLRTVDPMVVDGLLALVVLVPSLVGLTNEPTDVNPTPIDALAVACTVVGVGVLALRRRRPILTLWVAIVATFVYSLRDYLESGLAIAVLIALYTAAEHTPRRQWLWGAGAIAAFLLLMSVVRPEDLSRASLVGNLALFGIAAAFGDSNATRRANTTAVQARAEALEATQQIEAERAVTEERLRIARQLHDVVAHALAVIAVQSGAGSQVVEADPVKAKRVLDNIHEASRETLDEMRRMLGVLRSAEGERGMLTPAPGLGDLDQLVSGVREAGLEIDVDVVGADIRVPAGVELTAFRIVQEALTNVLKHAGPAHVAVTIDRQPGLMTVEVVDDGRGASAEWESGAGTHLGLIGMRERVSAFDGELATGPRTGGGWRVFATLPYERVDA